MVAPHGELARYKTQKCRCPLCRRANARASNQRRARYISGELPVPEHVHGTPNGHQNYGCRCGSCVDARKKGRNKT